MTRRAALGLLCLLGGLPLAHGYNGRLAIVLNKENSTTKLTAAQVRRIFLKQDQVWSNNESMVPVDWEAASEVRKQFSQKVLGRSVLQMREYWVQQMMTAGRTAPSTFGTARAVLRFVASVPGAISYVPEGEVDDKVKVVLLVE